MQLIYRLLTSYRHGCGHSDLLTQPWLLGSHVINSVASLQFQSERISFNRFVVATFITLLIFAAGCNQSGPGLPGDQINPNLYIQPVSGETVFDAEWKVIVPPAPLPVVENEQSVRLKLDGIKDMTHSDSLLLADGRKVTIAAEVFDDQGRRYPLTLGGIGDAQHAYFYRAGDYPPGPDFDVERTIVKIRMKSDQPLEVDEIEWVCTTTH